MSVATLALNDDLQGRDGQYRYQFLFNSNSCTFLYLMCKFYLDLFLKVLNSEKKNSKLGYLEKAGYICTDLSNKKNIKK